GPAGALASAKGWQLSSHRPRRRDNSSRPPNRRVADRPSPTDIVVSPSRSTTVWAKVALPVATSTVAVPRANPVALVATFSCRPPPLIPPLVPCYPFGRRLCCG